MAHDHRTVTPATEVAAIERGWIDQVDDGIVYGRIISDGEEREFWIPLLSIMESQRVELQPGSYITIRNDELAVDCIMWTTHDMEMADREASRWHRALFSSPTGASARMKEPPREVSIVPNSQAKTEVEG